MSFLNATATVPVEIAPYSDNETLIYQFHHNYRLIHGWVSAITCLFGIPCNLLNIIVLTQPNMIKSPTNLILSGLAVADLLTMVTYLPWSIFLHEVTFKCLLYSNIGQYFDSNSMYLLSQWHVILIRKSTPISYLTI